MVNRSPVDESSAGDRESGEMSDEDVVHDLRLDLVVLVGEDGGRPV
jgi:hypothetical protein